MLIDKTNKIENLEQTVAQHPESAVSFVELGRAYFDAEQYDKSVSAFHRALTLDPANVAAHNAIGHAHYRTGRLEQALASYERAIELDPHDDHAYYGIGILLCTQQGDYAGAIEAYSRGLAEVPGSQLLADAIGTTYARMGNYGKALSILENSCQKDPPDQFAMGWLLIVYLKAKRYDDVVAIGQRMLEAGPSDDAHRMMGYALLRDGKPEQAITHLREAVTLSPDDYEARGAVARAYAEVGQAQDALDHYRIAREEALKDNEYGQACFESVSGNIGWALMLLRVALQKGQEQIGWARIDPEFAFICDDPRYMALVGE